MVKPCSFLTKDLAVCLYVAVAEKLGYVYWVGGAKHLSECFQGSRCHLENQQTNNDS